MSNYAQRTAASAIARRLKQMFPRVDGIDFNVVGLELVQAVEMTAVASMHQREQQLQQTLKGLMEYYADLIGTTQERVRDLEKERMDLILQLGKYQDASAWEERVPG